MKKWDTVWTGYFVFVAVVIAGGLWLQYEYFPPPESREEFNREMRAGVKIAEEHVFDPENVILNPAEDWGDDVEGLKIKLAEEFSYECILTIDTFDPEGKSGKICIEADGGVRITGIVPNQYGEFWRGVAREFPGFLDAACHERLIERLRGK